MMYAMNNSITPFEDNPSGFDRTDYSAEAKKKIVSYMNSIEPDTALGLIWDCVKGEEVRQENVGYEDEKFIWSAQDIYHIDKYNAAVTDEFLDHVLQKMVS